MAIINYIGKYPFFSYKDKHKEMSSGIQDVTIALLFQQKKSSKIGIYTHINAI